MKNKILRLVFGTFNIFKIPVPNIFVFFILIMPLAAWMDVTYISKASYEKYLGACMWEFMLVVFGYCSYHILQQGRVKYNIS